jgi:hypothetical protein
MINRPYIAWDTETFPFRPGRMAPPVVVSSFADGNGNWLEPAWERNHKMQIVAYLEEAVAGGLLILGHVVAYDMCCIMADNPDLIPLVFDAYDANGIIDTALDQKLIDIGTGDIKIPNRNGKLVLREYKLGVLARRLLGEELDKDKEVREGFGEFWKVPLSKWPDRSKGYALKDSVILRPIHDLHENIDRRHDGRLLVDRHRQASHDIALRCVHAWGMRTDDEAVRLLRERTEQELELVHIVLEHEGLVRADGSRNIKAIRDRMLALWPGCPRTESGRYPQINEDTCNDSGDILLSLVSDYQRLQSTLSKDCRALEKGTTMPMHPYFDSLKTTGRTSSKKDKDSGIGHNAQNWGRKGGARECHAPREGRLYCACDFSQLELHTLAEVQYHVFGRSTLGDALNRGQDAHLMMAANVLGISYEEAKQRKDDPDVDDARQVSKPVNFGLAGGMGAQGLMRYAKANYKVEFDLIKAQWLIKIYHRTWPDMQGYFDWIRAMAGGGQLATVTHIYSGRLRAGIPYTVRSNTFFQGLASDAALAALYMLIRACYADCESVLYRHQCRVVNFPHDEAIVEVPAEPQAAHVCAMEIQNIMETTANRWITHCPTQAEPCLMWRWYKKAKPVYRDGMLVPWRPRNA